MLAATCNLINYWFIGIPIAVVLAFRLHWGVAGLWTGLLVATSIQGERVVHDECFILHSHTRAPNMQMTELLHISCWFETV